MTSYNPDIFIAESISAIKIRMFTKKLELKILKFGRMAGIFAMTKDFWDCREFKKKIYFSANIEIFWIFFWIPASWV